MLPKIICYCFQRFCGSITEPDSKKQSLEPTYLVAILKIRIIWNSLDQFEMVPNRFRHIEGQINIYGAQICKISAVRLRVYPDFIQIF